MGREASGSRERDVPKETPGGFARPESGVDAVCMQCACSAHAVCMQCACSAHAVCMQQRLATDGGHAVLILPERLPLWRLRDLDPALDPLAKLAQAQLAAAVGVPAVEERVDLGPGHLEPEQRHCLAELLAADHAVAVLVPLAEEVDHAHRLLGQDLRQLLLHREARRLVEVDSSQAGAALHLVGPTDGMLGPLLQVARADRASKRWCGPGIGDVD
eukprot:scaffold71571_cov66-Phaeocystis_antarctica.AAC.6